LSCVVWILDTNAGSLGDGGTDGSQMGHLDVHPCAGGKGEIQRPLPPGQSCSVLCPHRGSVCLLGAWTPTKGLGAGRTASWIAQCASWPLHTLGHCLQALVQVAFTVSHCIPSPPSLLLLDPVATTKVILCFSFRMF
jgi:hypothetical protein